MSETLKSQVKLGVIFTILYNQIPYTGSSYNIYQYYWTLQPSKLEGDPIVLIS